MRTARDRLQDILDAIARIEERLPQYREVFDSDPLVQVWMVHHLMIIGEAVRSLDPAFRQQHPSIPWRQISGMRNILVHDYFRIDKEIVWQTLLNDIPAFKAQIESLLKSLT